MTLLFIFKKQPIITCSVKDSESVATTSSTVGAESSGDSSAASGSRETSLTGLAVWLTREIGLAGLAASARDELT
jgi:hypothetical protein